MRVPSRSSIVILTGAGISAESGLSTFRDSEGLWENHRVEDVATPEAFDRNRDVVHRFYNQRRAQLKTVQPNAAHLALARLEATWPGGVTVITQNVDDLHERAGTCNLIHMHGELLKVRCQACHTLHRWEVDITPESRCPDCDRLQTLRPQVVWFGEMPLEPSRCHEVLRQCGLFVAIGTSGIVYPAADFVEMASPFAYTLELNLAPSNVSGGFFEARQGKATELVPALVDELLGEAKGRG